MKPNLTLRTTQPKEDTVTIAGREVTITQEPFMKAEVAAARSILHNLKRTRACATNATCTISSVTKVIES